MAHKPSHKPKDQNPNKPGVQTKPPKDDKPPKPKLPEKAKLPAKPAPKPPPVVRDYGPPSLLVPKPGQPGGGGAGAGDLPQGWEALLGLPWVMELINQSVINDWSQTELNAAIIGHPQFAVMFPGIFRPDGSLHVTVAEYRDYADQYRSVARRFGYDELPPSVIGALISGDIGNEEFADRLNAVKRASEVGNYKDAFKQILASEGIDGSALDTPQGQLDWVTGLAPDVFYEVYEKANILTSAKGAGFDIGMDQIDYIEKLTPAIYSEEQMQQSFSKLAQQAKQLLPMGRAYKFGLTNAELVELEFGGPQQATIADKVQRILATDKAQQEQTLATKQGQPGQRPRRAQSL